MSDSAPSAEGSAATPERRPEPRTALQPSHQPDALRPAQQDPALRMSLSDFPTLLPDLGPLPAAPVREGRYEVRAARTGEELRRALALRYEVFNLELGEGLASSRAEQLDRDAFDDHVHHLLVIDTKTDTVIGTYRLQTLVMARKGIGFYCDGEFHIDDLPRDFLEHGVEVGRACIARNHRKQRVLFALWKGIAAYLDATSKRYVFGVCSLTSQDPHEGLAVHAHLAKHGHRRDDVVVRARQGFACEASDPPSGPVPKVVIPPLFATYLRFHSMVYGPPVIDREFKTIDYLVVMDTHDLDGPTWKKFFGRAPPARG